MAQACHCIVTLLLASLVIISTSPTAGYISDPLTFLHDHNDVDRVSEVTEVNPDFSTKEVSEEEPDITAGHRGDVPVIVTDAENSPRVFDLEGSPNVEVGAEKDGMEVRVQVIPGTMAMVSFNAAPCGVSFQHSHPYSDELNYLLKAPKNLEVGHIAQNGSAIIVKNFKAGMTVHIPKGTLHWFFNKSCKKTVKAIQFFPTSNFGAVRPIRQVASIPRDLLEVRAFDPPTLSTELVLAHFMTPTHSLGPTCGINSEKAAGGMN